MSAPSGPVWRPEGTGLLELTPLVEEVPGGRSTEIMSPEVRHAFIAARMAEAGPERAFHRTAGRLVAEHPEQGLAFEATATGVGIAPVGEDSGRWTALLSVAGIGRVGDMEEPEAVEPEAVANRVEYRRGSVTEWYLHGPLGLEQGFEVPVRPDGEGQLLIEVEVGVDLWPVPMAGGEWIELADGGARGRLGYSDLFAIDAAGRALPARMYVVEGRIQLSVDDAGAAYPVLVDPLVWQRQAKIVAADGAEDDRFGWSIALSGDTAIVGACSGDVDGNVNQGSAYVFIRSGLTWTEQAKLVASDGAPNDYFGCAVAISGDTVVVGAYADDGVGGGATVDKGAAYVFVRGGVAWTQQAKLVASDAADDDHFGRSVALSDDTAVIGAHYDDIGSNVDQGSVYVFVRSGVTWTQQAKLVPSDGAADDWFGWAVAVSGETVVAGAREDDISSNLDQGSAYVYVRSGSTWTLQRKLVASDGNPNDQFGVSVAVSGDTAIVGADSVGMGATVDQGAAYVYVRSGVAWTQQAKLVAFDGATYDYFGYAVTISGDTAIVGAERDDVGAVVDQGSAYVFARSGVTWTSEAKLVASDGAAYDHFGWSVALSGDTAVIGAHYDDIGSNAEQGSAYVFRYLLPNGDACTSPDQCHSGYCVDEVCCNSTCGAGATDDCQACGIAAGATADGTCGNVVSGTLCRDATGVCDAVESCTGASATCPSDTFRSSTTECRASAGVCDVAETCTGASATCPSDTFRSSTTECRASAGVCDVAEMCTGATATCPNDTFRSSTTECRASAGVCDVAEACTGLNANCPVDALRPDTYECRTSAGLCDQAEMCTGASATCPSDTFRPSTTECRASAGVCDVAETCAGASATCPSDTFRSSTTECRASAGVCDVAETCTGATATCPSDTFRSSTTECRASAGVCDVAEACTGLNANCPVDALRPDTYECRTSAGLCDQAEMCTGASATCPSDTFRPSTTECRASAGVCDVAETCAGASATCPSDTFRSSTTECRASAGVCDVAETCLGSTALCPTDGFVSDGTPCPDADLCNGEESCQSGQCSPGIARSCDDADPCTTDLCNAATGCAHESVADGTTCDDGDACSENEICSGGVCASGTAVTCNDDNECTTDSCDPATGCVISVTPGVPCDDGNDTSTGDVCNNSGVCAGASAAMVHGGCACQTASGSGSETLALLALFAAVRWVSRRPARRHRGVRVLPTAVQNRTGSASGSLIA